MGPRRIPASDKDVDAASLSSPEIGQAVAEKLVAKSYCVIEGGFTEDLLKQAQETVAEIESQGRLKRPADLVYEGLFGSEGSSRIAELESRSSGLLLGEGLKTLDQALTDLGSAIAGWLVPVGISTHSRSPGLLHETGVPDGPVPDLAEVEASNWLYSFISGVLTCVIQVGPDNGVLELIPYEREWEAVELETVPGSMILFRSDRLCARHSCRRKTSLLSCFFFSAPSGSEKRTQETPLTPPAKKLNTWIESKLEQLKETEEQHRPDVPRDWLIAMNKQLFKGQHMACRGICARGPATWQGEIAFCAGLSGPDYLIEVPLVRWDHSTKWDPDPNCWKIFKSFTKHMAMMEGAEMFDNRMFNISPAESKIMDPQQRVVLETGYEALFTAGYKKGTILNSLGGMYLGYGTSTSDYSFVESSGDAGAEGSFRATGGSAAITANRFSFCLGMKGPSIAIDSEDASSLVAVHLGCEALQAKGRGQINAFSLCGGIKLNMSPYFWPMKQAQGFLSRTGRSLSFDASADGYSQGDAAINLVIKPLTEIVDGQVVLKEEAAMAVISGTAVNTVGRSASLGAPHGPSEQEVVALAVRAAGLSGFDIDAVESYAVGGSLSDPIEAASLMRVLRLSYQHPEPLGILSAKTNSGNSCHATGASSLLRAIFGNSWGVMSPSQHLRQLNPHLDCSEQPMAFPCEAFEYRLSCSYCGASARGFGGTNAHVIAWGKFEPERVAVAKAKQEEEARALTR